MKRQIINYPEFLKAIDGLFSANTVHSIKEYQDEASASKQRRKQKIAAVSTRLREMKAEIEKYKIKIRKAAEKDNKKEYGLRLNQLIRAKTELLKVYKEEKNLTPFSELSEEAKVYACTQSLLKKYLLAAFVKSSPEAYHINEDGTVTLNVDEFCNSILYQQASHIKDYVSSYIQHYPHRVVGGRYFTGLYKELPEFDDVLAVADEYFDVLNQNNEKLEENLQKSRQGIEVIESYPEYQAQAVRLLTKEALQYEGTEMEHCVATYSDKVKNGTTQIYSLRDNGDEYTEFVPHATIEFQDGKIKQIKGFKDSLVDMAYIKATRCLVKTLLHLNTDEEILNYPDIPLSEKNNIGFLKDTKGTLRDIFGVFQKDTEIVFEAVRVKANRIKCLNFSCIKFKTVTVIGAIMPKTIQHLATAGNLQKINLIYQNGQAEQTLNLSKLSGEEVCIELKKDAQARKIVLPSNIRILTITGNMPDLAVIEGTTLQELTLNGNFNSLTKIPPVSKEICFGGTFNGRVLETKSLHQLQKLTLKGSCDLFSQLNLPSLEKLELSEGTFENIEKFDFASYPSISNVNFFESTFPKLKEIKTSGNIKEFTGSHSAYPLLERIDLSQSPRKTFGVLEQDALNEIYFLITAGERAGEKVSTAFPALGGYLMNFTTLSALKELKFREDIEKINLTGIKFGAINPIDFSSYKNLEELSLQFTSFSDNTIIDLSQCTSLNKLSLDLEQVVNPPENIEKLDIRRGKDTPSPKTLDLRQYPHLKSLKLDFLPEDNKPLCVEELNIFLMDASNAHVKELDFSHIRHLKVATSMQLKLPQLERLVMSESFSSLHLFNLSPHLTEIDLSRTKGEVEIIEIDWGEEVMSSTGKIYLKSEQFNVIKKIKIGKETDLQLPPCTANLPITIELPADATDKEQELKTKYPHLQIARKQLPALPPRQLPYIRAGRL